MWCDWCNKTPPNQNALVPCEISVPWSKWQRGRQILLDPTVMSFTLKNMCKLAIKWWLNICQMCVHHPAKAGMCLCITDLAAGAVVGEKDANQQEVKPSMQQQDSWPEVSAVTCQAKEITGCHRPKAAVNSGQPNKVFWCLSSVMIFLRLGHNWWQKVTGPPWPGNYIVWFRGRGRVLQSQSKCHSTDIVWL